MTSFTTTDGARLAYFIDDFTDPCISPSGGSSNTAPVKAGSVGT